MNSYNRWSAYAWIQDIFWSATQTLSYVCFLHLGFYFGFENQMTRLLSEEYLWSSTESALRSGLAINVARGFPGCIGAWNFGQWVWEKCPSAWGSHCEEKEKTTVVLTVIADGELWIWGYSFSSSDSLIDVKILNQSVILQEVVNGNNSAEVSYLLNGNERPMTYFLPDGLYRNWSIF